MALDETSGQHRSHGETLCGNHCMCLNVFAKFRCLRYWNQVLDKETN